ncbi:MAG: hypothetical protein JWN25_18 [Verrucomicrobiales bacterium]|nr:hypothetical protein [Verrucomicrobiales bacterium]
MFFKPPAFFTRISSLFLFILVLDSAPLHSAVVSSLSETAFRQALSGGGTVTFSVDGTINLNSSIEISADTIIDAANHKIILSGQDKTRLFVVDSGITLKLNGLAMVQGSRPDSGGAIQCSGGYLQIVSCLFSNNFVGANGGKGGAIFIEDGTLNIQGSTFAQNQVWGPDVLSGQASDIYGGAIYSRYTDTVITNCSFFDNVVWSGDSYRAASGDAFGGAIYQFVGHSDISESRFSGNIALGGDLVTYVAGSNPNSQKGGSAFGGAIATSSFSTVQRCEFLDNHAWGGVGPSYAYGGAIYCSGRVNGQFLSVHDNSAEGGVGYYSTIPPYSGQTAGGIGAGGGIYYGTSSDVWNSDFHGNQALGGDAYSQVPGDAMGGGIYVQGTINATNVTIYANKAVGGGLYIPLEGLASGAGSGGGFYISGIGYFFHATIASNYVFCGAGDNSGFFGGGGGNDTVTFANSILAYNFPENLGNFARDNGGNISSDGSTLFRQPNSKESTDPKLDLLRMNGGGTWTAALKLGSPALDFGLTANAGPVDQRGLARPQGSRPDSGAYEKILSGNEGNTQLATRTSDGKLSLSWSGPPVKGLLLQSSVNFTNWINVYTNYLSADGKGTVVLDATNSSPLFYRTVDR